MPYFAFERWLYHSSINTELEWRPAILLRQHKRKLPLPIGPVDFIIHCGQQRKLLAAVVLRVLQELLEQSDQLFIWQACQLAENLT